MMESQWVVALTASGQGRVPNPIPGAVVGVVFPPEEVVPWLVGVALAPPLPPRLHAVSMNVAVKRSITLKNRRLEYNERSGCMIQFLQGKIGKRCKHIRTYTLKNYTLA